MNTHAHDPLPKWSMALLPFIKMAVLGAGWIGWAEVGQAQGAAVGEVVYVGSAQQAAGESGLLNMEVTSDPLSRIAVEYSPDFVEAWRGKTRRPSAH